MFISMRLLFEMCDSEQLLIPEQNNFFRQIRNFILDTTAMPVSAGTGIHWQVAQATSLQNIVFNMRSDGGTANQQQVSERMTP